MSVSTSALLVLVCLALLSTIVVEVTSAPNTEAPSDDKDEYCMENGVKYKKGESWSAPAGDCSIVTCEGKGFTSAMTCPEMRPGAEHCHMTPYDNTVQFPFCCPNVTCGEIPEIPYITLSPEAEV